MSCLLRLHLHRWQLAARPGCDRVQWLQAPMLELWQYHAAHLPRLLYCARVAQGRASGGALHVARHKGRLQTQTLVQTTMLHHPRPCPSLATHHQHQHLQGVAEEASHYTVVHLVCWWSRELQAAAAATLEVAPALMRRLPLMAMTVSALAMLGPVGEQKD